jgi:hypothetical protein
MEAYVCWDIDDHSDAVDYMLVDSSAFVGKWVVGSLLVRWKEAEADGQQFVVDKVTEESPVENGMSLGVWAAKHNVGGRRREGGEPLEESRVFLLSWVRAQREHAHANAEFAAELEQNVSLRCGGELFNDALSVRDSMCAVLCQTVR